MAEGVEYPTGGEETEEEAGEDNALSALEAAKARLEESRAK
jgi:hypothetical protein